MIAEYERAQILERSRRGKRHLAKAGEVSVLGGAPYSLPYPKTIVHRHATRSMPPKAEVRVAGLRQVIRRRPEIGAISRLLRGMGVPPVGWFAGRRRSSGILRNPAYKGTACF